MTASGVCRLIKQVEVDICGFSVESSTQCSVCIDFGRGIQEVDTIWAEFHCEFNGIMNGVQVVKEFMESINSMWPNQKLYHL